MQPLSASSRLGPSVTAARPLPGVDLDQITAGAGPALDYLSRAASLLAIPDPVQEYFGPVVGRWRDLHEQAERWRRAGNSIEELGERLTTPLGGLDAVWDGKVSDTFVEHMRQIGAASKSASDAMTTMADVLDRTADGVHQLVIELVELLSGGANRVSSAMILPSGGEEHASRLLAEIRGYSRRVFEAVRELLEAFAEMCKSLDVEQPFAEVRMATAFPQQTWSFPTDLPPVSLPVPQPTPEPVPLIPPEPAPAVPTPGTAGDLVGAGPTAAGGGFGGGGATGIAASSGPGGPPAGPAEPAVRTLAAEPASTGQPTSAAGTGAGAAAAAGGAGAGQRGGLGAGMMPMGAMAAGQGGQDEQHRSKSRITADPTELFGKPTKTAPPVIGDE